MHDILLHAIIHRPEYIFNTCSGQSIAHINFLQIKQMQRSYD